ncbi:BatA domain-containing protein [Ulvibacter litoralis]|uniref:N-terminal double-transmembrane domain-containing protein n=1 Tax=Ulvibacter litoralis TaxID=227084 RepID=A0A1G7F972_9FLAO|nr:BatA domain-containing protein [Ulvibacter litoralis]GHC52140.1 membrane protein [Ulvibacter litoralis]SDE72510.1 N-terminal double-transmembrane domain-containing protein [Ulvibacter litoralis]
MQFKHPELLYALFLLLIPIIIHLFQLRRFQKVDFTNVAFLKKVTIQTRKSSQLKKWLTLLMRLGALACLILAFAQPFTASKTALNTNKETVLYLDNSFSMQAKGSQGPLLQRAIKEIYERTGSEKISWFTNDFSRKNAAPQDFKSELLKVSYSQKQLSPSEVLLKANQLYSKEKGSFKRLVYISDFQLKEAFPETPQDLTIDAVQLKPDAMSNIAIDTAYIDTKNTTTTKLNVVVSSLAKNTQTVPISLYNGATLIAKTAVDFSETAKNTITFDINTSETFKGRLEINDPNLTFDNTLYFSINTPQKIKVLSINEGNANYLQRLFNQPEFEYQQESFNSLNYNDIATQNFIVVNEVKDIPTSLTTALKSFSDNGGSLFVIPSEETNITSFNTLLNSFSIGNFSEERKQEKQITQIVFDHPLYRDVFEKRVVNFQYPKVNSYYDASSNATAVLQFEDGKPFILQKQNTYISTAAINSENSNFQNSPLIVPTLYNMAQQSLKLPKLYYNIGQQNTFSVPVALIQDEILTLQDSINSFIPLQQTKANQVNITTTEMPTNAGIFQIKRKEQFLENISYNYNRSESHLQYADATTWDGVTTYKNIDALFTNISKENTINSFWKWFVIFALLFLLLEMLILKFKKN